MSVSGHPQHGRRSAARQTAPATAVPPRSAEPALKGAGPQDLIERPRDAARRVRAQAAASAQPASSAQLAQPASAAQSASAVALLAQAELRRVPVRGRRRAQTAPAGRRASLPTGVPRSAKTLQRSGIVLAAASLALAVLVPSAAAGQGPQSAVAQDNSMAQDKTAQNSSTQNSSAQDSSAQVSADSNVTLEFAQSGSSGTPDPDGKLHQALSVSAAKVAPAEAKGTLSAPLRHLVPSSPFGYRVNPLTGAMGELHTGQDFAIGCGTEVYAAAGGTVTFAGWHNGGGGNRVVIDHGNGLSTSYNHNSSLTVQVGQRVSRGDVVALSGTTGASTGCHLHFEVMINGQTVDPLGWL